MTNLFDSIQLGSIDCANRIIMAPLTRSRAGESRIPNDLMAEYYAQRASAGLIISEATAISAQGYGWYGAPGIYEDSHIEGWKKTTEAVHAKGGKIVLQLWHMGRLSHPEFHNGELPVAPSEIAPTGTANTSQGRQPYVEPRALRIEEIKAIVQDYVAAAARATAAGFDGVEIHGANGYLIDQFLKDGANQRTDEYGGSVENRCRFALEVVKAVTDAIGADKVGLRISPVVDNGGISDSDPMALVAYLSKALNEFDLAYLHVREDLQDGHKPALWTLAKIRENFKGKLIVNGHYTKETAEEEINSGEADAVVFGVPFIANPDLVERFKQDAPLNEPRPESFYKGTTEGYTDYPFLAA